MKNKKEYAVSDDAQAAAEKFILNNAKPAAHTKTPWKMRQEIRAMPKRMVEDKKGITDFYTDGEPMMGLPVKKLVAQCEYLNEANAAFIVRAVNAHLELLSCLKEIYEWTDHKNTSWAKRAKEAIARAEGRV